MPPRTATQTAPVVMSQLQTKASNFPASRAVDSAAVPLVASPQFIEGSPTLSADGGWLAYHSNDNGGSVYQQAQTTLAGQPPSSLVVPHFDVDPGFALRGSAVV